MSNRYYICRRIGTGVPGSGTPYTAELRVWIQANYGIKPKQQIIAHTIPWVLMKYDLTVAQHDAAMLAVPQCFTFPATALDNTLNTVAPATRTNINNKLTELGFNTSWITLQHTVRDVLQFIAHSIQLSEWAEVQISALNFDTQTKTVADIPVPVRNRITAKLLDLGVDITPINGTTPLWQVIRYVQRQADGITPRLFGAVVKRRWFYHDEESS